MIKSPRLVVILALLLLPGADQSCAADKDLPVVYDDVTNGSGKLDREARRIYGDKFRLVETTQKESFVPPRVKGFDVGTYRMAYRDPRGTREREQAFKVVCLFVITADGRVIEPRVTESTDPRMSKAILDGIVYRRWVPATFRGKPVACLSATEEAQGPKSDGPDSKNFRNGLNIQGYRDR